MPIYKGSTKIGQIFKGSSELNSLYKGSDKVFSKAQPIPPETLVWDLTNTSTYSEFSVPETGWYRCEFVSGGCGTSYTPLVSIQSYMGSAGGYVKKWIYVDKAINPNAVFFATVGAGSAGAVYDDGASGRVRESGGSTIGGLKNSPNGTTLATAEVTGGTSAYESSIGGHSANISGDWSNYSFERTGENGGRTWGCRVSPYDGTETGYGAGGADNEYSNNGKNGFFRVYKTSGSGV